ncbi:MAG: J domain-containing protein [Acidobacteriota bacterium]
MPGLEEFAATADKVGVHPPFPIDEATRARIQDAYRPGSAGWWDEGPGSEPLLTQVEPLLGANAEPDPTFFVESWTIGVSAASENYLHRHQESKNLSTPMPAGFSRFTFLPFLNIEPAVPVSSAAPVTSSGSVREASVSSGWQEAEMEPAMFAPLTFETACRLLGVAASSTREQIRAAYRKMAGRYHPDRMGREGNREQKQASDRMAAINEAYRLLTTAIQQEA